MKQILLVVLFKMALSTMLYAQSTTHFLEFFLKNRKEKYLQKEATVISNSDIKQLKAEYSLSKEDSAILINKEKTKTVFKKKNYSSLRLIRESRYEQLRENNDGIEVLFLSKPVFIDNGKKIIIKAETQCGSLCGEGMLYI